MQQSTQHAMYVSIISNETGDKSVQYTALKVGLSFYGLSRVETPDGHLRRRVFYVKGSVHQVQKHLSALRTAYLWLWASRVEPNDLLAAIDSHQEIVATSAMHPDSERLTSQCMAAEEVAKIAQQALKNWYGVTPAKARKIAVG